LEGELEAKYREVRRELVAKRWERAPDKYEDMRRELVARRKERELEKQRRESSDESAGRPSGRVYRGASRVGDNLGTR